MRYNKGNGLEGDTMALDFHTIGRLLLVVNFVLVAGVVAAGTDLLSTAPPQAPRDGAVFREVRPPEAKAGAPASPFTDYKDVTGAKFGGPGGKNGRSAAPGVRSALENSYRVTGTMLSNNEAFNCAVVEEVGTGRQRTVFAGDDLGPAKVKAIRASEVEVEMRGELEVLKLDMAAPDKKALEKKGNGKKSGNGRGNGKAKNPEGGQDAGGEQNAGGGAPGEVRENAPEPASPADVPELEGIDIPADVSQDLIQDFGKLSADDRKKAVEMWKSRSPEERKKLLEGYRKMIRQRRGKGN
jgi:hypothetical protein